MKLPEIFNQVSIRMKSDIEEIRKAIDHPGEKGTSFEEVFRKFLRQYLPKSLAVANGFIVNSYGNKSRQIDVIIYDAAKTPIFFENGERRIVPIECVMHA